MIKYNLEEKLKTHNNCVDEILKEFCDLTTDQMQYDREFGVNVGFALNKVNIRTNIVDPENTTENEQKLIEAALKADIEHISNLATRAIVQEDREYIDRLYNHLTLPLKSFHNKKEFKNLSEGIDNFCKNALSTNSILWISNDLVEDTINLNSFHRYIVPEIKEDNYTEYAKITLSPIGKIHGFEIKRKDSLPNKTFALINKATPKDRPFAARTYPDESLKGLFYDSKNGSFVRYLGISPKGLNKVHVGTLNINE